MRATYDARMRSNVGRVPVHNNPPALTWCFIVSPPPGPPPLLRLLLAADPPLPSDLSDPYPSSCSYMKLSGPSSGLTVGPGRKPLGTSQGSSRNESWRNVLE